MNENERLVLGTAQLGMPYGVANQSGQPDQATANTIIKAAWDRGIREFDTARQYGESEDVLGNALDALHINTQVRITTKLGDCRSLAAASIREQVAEALEKLRVEKLHCLMLHSEEDGTHWEQLASKLFPLVEDGLVDHLGISVYSPAAAERAIASEGLTCLQIPASAFDRRFLKDDIPARAQAAGMTVYIRSIFLQGLLAMRAEDVPDHLIQAVPHVRKFENIAKRHDIKPLAMAMAYIRQTCPGCRVLFGAETLCQVNENIVNWNASISGVALREIEQSFADVPDSIVNPTLWEKTE